MTKKLYRKAIVTRTDPALVAKYGEQAFDGLFTLPMNDKAIISYFSDMMALEGYKPDQYRIDLATVHIDPATGTAHAVDFLV